MVLWLVNWTFYQEFLGFKSHNCYYLEPPRIRNSKDSRPIEQEDLALDGQPFFYIYLYESLARADKKRKVGKLVCWF